MTAYTNECLAEFAEDVKTCRIPVFDRLRLTDDVVPGLRIHIFRDSSISYLANYRTGGRRTEVRIGDAPEISLERARELTKKIHVIAKQGVDPMEEQRRKMIAAL